MRALTRFYRLLLKALPGDFQRAYGDEMEQLFRLRLARARSERGAGGSLAVAARELVDALATALRLRMRAVREHPRAGPVPGREQHGPAGRRPGPRDALGGFWRDLRAALRGLRRRPRYAVTAIATLALGLGSAIAIFSVVDAVLLRPLPYPESDRLVMVWRILERYGWDRAPVSYPDFLDWRAGSRSFDHVAAYGTAVATLLGDGEPERLVGARVTGGLFRTLGVGSALGRTVEPADDRPDAEPVVVLSHDLWLRRFGGDPRILGRTIELGEERPRVVGVMPPGFDFPDPRYEYWVPLRLDPAEAERDSNFLRVVGRIALGLRMDVAEAELRSVADRVAAAHPGANEIDGVWLESRHAFLIRDVRPALLVLAGAVGLLLLLACANLTNLLLVRAAGRGRELAIRAALGAGRARLGWPLVCEGLGVAVLGGLVGIWLAMLLTHVFLAIEPGELPRRGAIGLDIRVVVFSIALTLACGLLCSLLPAWMARRRAPVDRLREGGGAVGSRSAQMLQTGLAIAQVALACVVLVGAGLLGHSLHRLLSVPPGFDAARVLTAHVSLPPGRYGEAERVNAFYHELLTRLEALPGVEAVGATWALPFSPAYAFSDYVPADAAEGTAARTIVIAPVRGDYFRALGMTLLRGRGITAADDANAPAVAVVNETLARAFWPGEDPLGKQLRGANPSGENVITVVGVVRDVKRTGLDAATEPEAYVPHRQALWGKDLFLTVRASGEPSALAPAVRREALALEPAAPVTAVRTLADRVDDTVAAPRFRAALFVALAVTAALIALVGIYGVLSFVVAQRGREIGVRVALGARPGRVLSDVLSRGLRIAVAGLSLGMAAAVLASRSLQAFLFEVGPLDPIAYAGVASALLAAALLASYMPARRAAGIDPVAALREE